MKFLTDVKAKKFVCIVCRQTALIVTLEGIKTAFCDTPGCTNTNTLVNFDGKWQELEHEQIFEVNEIQNLLTQEFVTEGMARRAQDNSPKRLSASVPSDPCESAYKNLDPRTPSSSLMITAV